MVKVIFLSKVGSSRKPLMSIWPILGFEWSHIFSFIHYTTIQYFIRDLDLEPLVINHEKGQCEPLLKWLQVSIGIYNKDVLFYVHIIYVYLIGDLWIQYNNCVNINTKHFPKYIFPCKHRIYRRGCNFFIILTIYPS